MRMPGRPKALNQVVSLPVGSILPSPHQPRRDFNLAELDILAKSIAQNGLLCPITVRKDPEGGNRYFLIAGERRLLACRRLGYEEVPAVISTAPEANAAVLTLHRGGKARQYERPGAAGRPVAQRRGPFPLGQAGRAGGAGLAHRVPRVEAGVL